MITKVSITNLDDKKKVTWPDLEKYYSGNYSGLVEIMYSDELVYDSKFQYKFGIAKRVWNLRRRLINPFTDRAFIKSLVKAGTIQLRD